MGTRKLLEKVWFVEENIGGAYVCVSPEFRNEGMALSYYGLCANASTRLSNRMREVPFPTVEY